jgi:hypothetical protein
MRTRTATYNAARQGPDDPGNRRRIAHSEGDCRCT